MKSSDIMRRTSGVLDLFELAALAGLAGVALVFGPYLNISVPGGGAVASIALFTLGVALLVGLLRFLPEPDIRAPNACVEVTIRPFVNILCVGVLATIVTATLTAPAPTSDMRVYLDLAERVANGLSYVDRSGDLAFWPPGLPLALSPFVAVLGAGLFAVVTLNTLLYVIGFMCTWDLTARIFGDRAALVAVWMFTLWPNRMLLSGVAAKENLLLAALLAAIALIFAAFRISARRALVYALLGGASLGLAALAQPGLLLLVCLAPVAFRTSIRESSVRKSIATLLSVALGAAVVVGPWMHRNCSVFEGEFCGVTTSGGSVFYRANNPKASGLWTSEQGTPLEGLPEIKKNEVGFDLGRQWALSHPLDALRLSARKVLLFLGDDSYGAYWAIYRGEGGSDQHAMLQSSETRLLAWKAAEYLSLTFWWILLGSCLATIRAAAGPGTQLWPRMAPLAYPFLYSALVFAVFESGSRQHVAPVGLLIVLAAPCFAAIAQKIERLLPQGGTLRVLRPTLTRRTRC